MNRNLPNIMDLRGNRKNVSRGTIPHRNNVTDIDNIIIIILTGVNIYLTWYITKQNDAIIHNGLSNTKNNQIMVEELKNINENLKERK